MPVSSIISVSFRARDPFSRARYVHMYMCVAHSGREVGGSEAKMIIPADQTESRKERSKVEEFYVTQERKGN